MLLGGHEDGGKERPATILRDVAGGPVRASGRHGTGGGGPALPGRYRRDRAATGAERRRRAADRQRPVRIGADQAQHHVAAGYRRQRARPGRLLAGRRQATDPDPRHQQPQGHLVARRHLSRRNAAHRIAGRLLPGLCRRGGARPGPGRSAEGAAGHLVRRRSDERRHPLRHQRPEARPDRRHRRLFPVRHRWRARFRPGEGGAQPAPVGYARSAFRRRVSEQWRLAGQCRHRCQERQFQPDL